MAVGIRIRNPNNNLIIGPSQTFLRLVAQVSVPYKGSTSVFNVPQYDDTQGFFTISQDTPIFDNSPYTNEGGKQRYRGVPYESILWANGPKTLTVTHLAANGGHTGAFLVLFLHYR